MATYHITQTKALANMIRRKIDYAMRRAGEETDRYAIQRSPRWSGAFQNNWKLTRGFINNAYLPQPQPWEQYQDH